MTTISLIAAVSLNNIIGTSDGRLPWNIQEDLLHFKNKTMGKPIIMGRKTHESVGKKLPGRPNIVISRDNKYTPKNKLISVYQDVNKAIKDFNNYDEIMIIGGGEIYTIALPVVTKMYLTRVLSNVQGDVVFPSFNKSEWVTENYKLSSDSFYTYAFIELRRR